MKKLLYFYVLLLLLSACKHEPYIAPLPDECRFKDKSWLSFAKDTCNESLIRDSYSFPKYQYGAAYFNPNNSNEIIYHRYQMGVLPEIWKMNLCTGEKYKIVDNAFGSMVDWSKQDWLAGIDAYNNLYIVKSNGDSLQHLTTGQISWDPTWYADGRSILIRHGNSIPTYKLMKVGIDGSQEVLRYEVINTVVTMSPDNRKVAWANSDNMKILDYLIPNASPNIVATSFTKTMREANWLFNSKEIIWSEGFSGTFRTNIETLKTTRIFDACKNPVKIVSDISANGKQMLISRVEIKGVMQFCQVSIADIDGKSEVILNLDEE